MNLEKKKLLAARTLGVGKDRIGFNAQRLDEIKEAITRQDIRDLMVSKAIFVKEVKGRKKAVKRRTRRRSGSIKIKVKKKKEEYMTLTRKLRDFAKELRKKGVLSSEQHMTIRKEIRARAFKNKTQLKERIKNFEKED